MAPRVSLILRVLRTAILGMVRAGRMGWMSGLLFIIGNATQAQPIGRTQHNPRVQQSTGAQHPPPAYQAAARAADVPASVLFAVALQESGTRRGDRVIPWPWTLNVAGTPSRYSNRTQACSALKSSLKHTPATRVDVGLAQVNVGYHGHRVKQPCELLDPYQNLAIAASILREHHEPGEDWLVAIGRYHRPAGGELAARYRTQVKRHLLRLSGNNSTHALRSASP